MSQICLKDSYKILREENKKGKGASAILQEYCQENISGSCISGPACHGGLPLFSTGQKNRTDINANDLPPTAQSLDKEVLTISSANKQESLMEGLEVVQEIGRGSYGTVWLVRRPGSLKNMVLKRVELSHCSTSEIEAARREVLILAGLRHPNIVSYKGSFEVEQRLHLLMGYCEGGDLASHIRHQHGCLFPELKVIRWLIQITMALEYLHSQNILHRDLKTQNIFLTRGGLIKLGDFGIARVLGSSLDMATTLVGTPFYMSPERFAGLSYNYKSDIWALGCCLYELATLKHAFPARDIPTLIYRISRGKVGGISGQYSDELRGLVFSLLTRDPDLRPSTSHILRLPYIRHHMSLFLRDTSSGGEESREQEHLVTGENRHRKSEVFLESCALQSAGDSQPVCDGRPLSVHAQELSSVQKPNTNARRCCEFLPSEFESLHIAGDKMKLGDRGRGERRPSGAKECNCPRREKNHQKQQPFTAGHVHSQSRTRRRGNKEAGRGSGNEDQSVNQLDLSAEPLHHEAPETPRSLSARERRRQKRQDVECSESLLQYDSSNDKHSADEDNDMDGQVCKSLENSDNSSDSDLDMTSSIEATITPKTQEEDDFFYLLSTTLTDPSTSSEDKCKRQEKDGNGKLEAKISQLEETLLDKVGETQAKSVMEVVGKVGIDDWEKQQNEVQHLLGHHLYSKAASTVWHLYLCYSFRPT